MRTFTLLLTILIPVYVAAVCDDGVFIRGDADGNGLVNFQDAMAVFNYASSGSPIPCDMDAADANDDGFVSGVDGTAILNQVWNGIPLPPPSGYGVDLTPDWTANQFSPRHDAFLEPICCTWGQDVLTPGYTWVHNWPTEMADDPIFFGPHEDFNEQWDFKTAYESPSPIGGLGTVLFFDVYNTQECDQPDCGNTLYWSVTPPLDMVDHVVGTWPHNRITYRVRGHWTASHTDPCYEYPWDCPSGWGEITVSLLPVEAYLVNLNPPNQLAYAGSVVGPEGHFEWVDTFLRYPQNGCHIAPTSRTFDGEMETGCLLASGTSQLGVKWIDMKLQISYVHGTDDPVKQERITGWVAVEFAIERNSAVTTCP